MGKTFGVNDHCNCLLTNQLRDLFYKS